MATINIYKIGESVQRRDMLAVEIYHEEHSTFGEPISTPELRLMGNIHGNEDQGLFILVWS